MSKRIFEREGYRVTQVFPDNLQQDFWKDGFIAEHFDLSWSERQLSNLELYQIIANQANAKLFAELEKAQTVSKGLSGLDVWEYGPPMKGDTHTGKLVAVKEIKK